MPFCPNCGKLLANDNAFCPSCGHNATTTTTILPPQKSKEATGLLGLFFGSLGVHDFYVGKVTQGVIKLVLTFTVLGYFVSAIWRFVDVICIITGSYHDNWNRPLTGDAPITKILLILPILLFILIITLSIFAISSLLVAA